MKSNYIKITPSKGGDFTVVPASNEAFYKSQGYKVEEPTQEEIEQFFPSSEKEKTLEVKSVEETEEYKSVKAELETVKTELEALKAKPVNETAEYIALMQELETAKSEKTTLEAKVTELEKQIVKK